MNQFETVTYEVSDSVATVMLNRPKELNAINRQLGLDLAAALTAARQDRAVRVVLLAAHGRAFSAGADLKAGMPMSGATVTQRLKEEFKPGLLALAEMDKPVLCAVQGSAAGIGLSYALSADLIMMAESAFFMSPFANIGLIPDGGLSWILPLQIGYRRAYQWAVECDRIPASQCLELGLVNRIVADEQLHSGTGRARSLAARAPLALSLTKRVMRQAERLSFAEMIDLEAELQAQCIDSHDCREGITAFLEKRPPQFTGQ